MNAACLLIHGFCGSPFEIQPLAPALLERGYHVEIPTLPGHNTTIEDIKNTFYTDWLNHCQQLLFRLQSQYPKVFLIGFSLGGSIALDLATRHTIQAVVTLSSPCRLFRLFPLEMRSPLMPFLPLMKHITPYVPYRTASQASKAISPFQGYEGVLCLPQLASMGIALTTLRKNLHKVTCPALIMHDLHDRISFPSNALEIAQKLSSPDIELTYTRAQEHITSHHHIVTHQELQSVIIQKVTAFIEKHK